MKYRIEVQQVYGTEGMLFDKDAQWLQLDSIKPNGKSRALKALRDQVAEWKTGAPHRLIMIRPSGSWEVLEVLS